MVSGLPDFSRGFFFMGQTAGVWTVKEYMAKIGYYKWFWWVFNDVAPGTTEDHQLYTVPSGKTLFISDVFVCSWPENFYARFRILIVAPDGTTMTIYDMLPTKTRHDAYGLPAVVPSGWSLWVEVINKSSTDTLTLLLISILGFEV